MSDELKRAIRKSGMTGLELSRRSGVPTSGLSRFMGGTAEMRSRNIDRLCRALGLVLVAKSGKSRKEW